MLQELVEYLVDLGQTHREAKVLPFPNSRDKSLLLVDGKLIEQATPREPPQTHSLTRTIEDFANAVSLAAEARQFTDPPTIWLTPQKAVAVFDSFREQTVSVHFDPHPQVTALLKFETPQILDQVPLVRLLRHTLAGCVADPSVLARFREINWETQAGIRRKIQNASSSMDSDIVSRSTSTGGQPPEEFEASVPLFTTRELRAFRAVGKLTVDIDAGSQKFTLELLPGEADAIREEILAVLRGKLQAALPESAIVAGVLSK